MNRADRKRLAKIDKLHAKIPSANCKGECQDTCGLIFLSQLEYNRILERLVKIPDPASKYGCPLLENGKCSVYDIRPTICRIWGTTPKTTCSRGCKPDHVLSDDEARELLKKIEEIGGGLAHL